MGVLNPSKVLIVSLHPKTPRSQEKDIHEERLSPITPTSMQKSQSVVSCRPCHSNYIPAVLTKGAIEEQMFHRFLWRVLTEHTCIVAPHDNKMSAFEHIPGIQTIN